MSGEKGCTSIVPCYNARTNRAPVLRLEHPVDYLLSHQKPKHTVAGFVLLTTSTLGLEFYVRSFDKGAPVVSKPSRHIRLTYLPKKVKLLDPLAFQFSSTLSRDGPESSDLCNLPSGASQIWLWVKTNATILGLVYHPF